MADTKPSTDRGTETTAASAWRAYFIHSQDCGHCARHLTNCPAGAELYQAWRDARSGATR